MKRIMIYVVTLITLFGSVFAYTPTEQDQKVLNAFYKKLDTLYTKDKNKVDQFKNTVGSVQQKFVDNERIYYILGQLIVHIDSYDTAKDILEGPFKVVEVIDGDTFKVDYNGTLTSIRLIGIDAPEKSKTRYGYDQCFGDESTKYSKDNVEGKDVYLEFDSTQGRLDKYSRMLVYVFMSGYNWNQSIIENGYGFEYTYNKPYKYQNDFKEAEQNAMSKDIGVWDTGTCNYTLTSHTGSGYAMTGNILESILPQLPVDNSIIAIEDDSQTQDIAYDCKGKKTCGSMRSCEEAEYYLNVCGVTALDRDKDGIPCESLCK